MSNARGAGLDSGVRAGSFIIRRHPVEWELVDLDRRFTAEKMTHARRNVRSVDHKWRAIGSRGPPSLAGWQRHPSAALAVIQIARATQIPITPVTGCDQGNCDGDQENRECTKHHGAQLAEVAHPDQHAVGGERHGARDQECRKHQRPARSTRDNGLIVAEQLGRPRCGAGHEESREESRSRRLSTMTRRETWAAWARSPRPSASATSDWAGMARASSASASSTNALVGSDERRGSAHRSGRPPRWPA